VFRPLKAVKLEPKARCPDSQRGAPCTNHEPPALEEGGWRQGRLRASTSNRALGLQLRPRPRPQRRAAAVANALLREWAAAAQPSAHPDVVERPARADLRVRRGNARRGRGAAQRRAPAEARALGAAGHALARR
ncbi:polymerase (DNA directed), gamma, isoform CRA_c, partial [Mus musculus]